MMARPLRYYPLEGRVSIELHPTTRFHRERDRPIRIRQPEGCFYPPSANFAPQREPRKVMLPPRVTFPARQPFTSSKQTCWGCGLEGPFLSDCPITNPRLLEIVLEGFRARKRERMTKITPAPPMAPPPPDRRSFSAVDGPVTPRAMARPIATQPRAVVAHTDKPSPGESSENPSAMEDESL